jgi:hypothetical protein
MIFSTASKWVFIKTMNWINCIAEKRILGWDVLSKLNCYEIFFSVIGISRSAVWQGNLKVKISKIAFRIRSFSRIRKHFNVKTDLVERKEK